MREAATICPRPCKLTFDLLTLKEVSESRVTWATSVPILVFLGFSVLDLGPMYATDRRQTSDAHHRLMPPPYGDRGIIMVWMCGHAFSDTLRQVAPPGE